jgi:hypothetical protein
MWRYKNESNQPNRLFPGRREFEGRRSEMGCVRELRRELKPRFCGRWDFVPTALILR